MLGYVMIGLGYVMLGQGSVWYSRVCCVRLGKTMLV